MGHAGQIPKLQPLGFKLRVGIETTDANSKSTLQHLDDLQEHNVLIRFANNFGRQQCPHNILRSSIAHL